MGIFGAPRGFGELLPLGFDPTGMIYRFRKPFLRVATGFLISLSRFGLRVGFLNPPLPPKPFVIGIKRDMVIRR